MYGYIYKTTDKFTNLIYIGKKKSETFLELNYIGSGLIISSIKKKCEKENIPLSQRFKVELLDTANTLEELNQKEIYYINQFNSRNSSIGYNIASGGDGGPLFKGHRHDTQTKIDMSKNRTGVLNANYNNHWNQSDKLKQLHSELSKGENNGMFGKKHSQESKNKNANSHLGKLAISQVELNKVIMIYPSQIDDYVNQGWIIKNIHHNLKGLKRSNETKSKISKALKGKTKSEQHKQKISNARKRKLK